MPFFGRFMMETYQQMDLFHDNDDPLAETIQDDPRPPVTVTWNLWHGCKKVSPGCANCYMFRRDEEYGKDPTNVHKTSSFSLPVRKYRSGPYKGLHRIPAGSLIYTCFTSDFFIEEADDWRLYDHQAPGADPSMPPCRLGQGMGSCPYQLYLRRPNPG